MIHRPEAPPHDRRRRTRQAKQLLEQAGIRKSVMPPTLVAAANELKKPLRETLAYVARLLAEAEGLG